MCSIGILKTILIFPSVIETFGLPLQEAKEAKAIIFAADLPYAHEILYDYPNAYFFNPNNAGELATLIKNSILGKISYKLYDEMSVSKNKNELLDSILK